MKNLFILLTLTIVVTGCQHFSVSDVADIDTSKKDQTCIRQCTVGYSNCVGGAFGIAAQNSCVNGFKVCSNTCPAKN